jgi:hypothetical protein
MFRLLYLVVLVAGLFWILQTRPLWLDPERAADMRPRAAADGGDWQDQEEARSEETIRRVKIVGMAAIGVILVGEAWVLAYHRLKLFRRT